MVIIPRYMHVHCVRYSGVVQNIKICVRMTSVNVPEMLVRDVLCLSEITHLL